MVIIDGETLTFDKIKRILMDKEKVDLSKTALEKVVKSRQAVEKIVEEERVIYGITTGFGKLSDVFIPKEDVEELQLNLIRSHACGVGEPFSNNVAKIMLLLRANALMKGFSGVRPVVIERLIDCVNHEIIPVVPQQGSLGASGDLAPLSHLALVIMGEGEVFYEGEKQSALAVFQKNGLFPVTLTAKEGLALINGTQAMTAQGIIAYLEAERLAEEADAIASLTIEALRGIITAYDEKIHLARGYQEQVDVATRLRTYLKDSKLVTQQGELRVQDAYSLRCIPQVHGATWQTLAYVKEKLSIEMNAATDNPLIFDDGELVISGGNFHGQPIALAMDYLGIAMAEIANIAERRIERLVNPQLNDLPAFLSQKSGLESGAMILQYTAASLVSENKTLAHPASVDSIPSSANQEDHVSMGTIGSRHAYQIIKNVNNVLSIELFCAMLALQFRDKRLMASKTTAILAALHKQVQPVTGDRIFSKDIKIISDWLMAKVWDQLLIPLKEENVHEA